MVAVVSLATKAPHRCMVLDHVLWHGTSWVSRDIRSGQLLVNRSHHSQRGIYVRLGKDVLRRKRQSGNRCYASLIVPSRFGLRLIGLVMCKVLVVGTCVYVIRPLLALNPFTNKNTFKGDGENLSSLSRSHFGTSAS